MSWLKVPLCEVATLEREGELPSSLPANTPYIGLEHIDGNGTLCTFATVGSAELKSTKFHFCADHVLFGKLRPYLRKIARPNFDGVCSTDIIPIRPGKQLDRGYLFHFLRSPSMVSLATSRSSGANLPRLSPTQLESFEIPVPPLNEQKRIATILDAADFLRVKRRRSIDHLDTLIQSIFLETFGDPVTNPKGWNDTVLLGEVAEITSGLTKGRKLQNQFTREIPYLAVVNVQDRHLVLTPLKTIEATDAEIAKFRLLRNDLLLTEGGDRDKLGRGTLWQEELPECIHQNHIFRVRLHDKRWAPVFVNWLTGSERGKRYFLSQAKQTTGIASINLSQLKRFPLLLPPLHLQQRFALAVETIESHKNSLKAQHAELESLFASLQVQAFSGEPCSRSIPRQHASV
jgi:type I restriction enzyme S subunit